jgi:hypothetical protein
MFGKTGMLKAITLAIKKEVAMTKSVLQKEKLISFCVINNTEILNVTYSVLIRRQTQAT